MRTCKLTSEPDGGHPRPNLSRYFPILDRAGAEGHSPTLSEWELENNCQIDLELPISRDRGACSRTHHKTMRARLHLPLQEETLSRKLRGDLRQRLKNPASPQGAAARRPATHPIIPLAAARAGACRPDSRNNPSPTSPAAEHPETCAGELCRPAHDSVQVSNIFETPQIDGQTYHLHERHHSQIPRCPSRTNLDRERRPDATTGVRKRTRAATTDLKTEIAPPGRRASLLNFWLHATARKKF